MKMTRVLMMAGLIVALGSGAALAQSFSCDVAGPYPIPDDGYDGTLGSMVCCTITASDFGSGTTISDLDVTVEAVHTWVGDLTIKVQSPAATTTTLMSRPGLVVPDDGSSCCGYNADWEGAAVTFDDEDAGAVSAEDMGITAAIICTGDGVCGHIPAPDGGPGVNLSDFDTEDLVGAWLVCVGDSGGGDTGELMNATLTFGAVPVELMSFSVE
ncbi:MAG: hypothetical protein DRJ65_11010 [Acidobacteria bacterium]|nr:MAG: hypothetical protein DRJ65_11010 [Acidobacteriota bacterium]